MSLPEQCKLEALIQAQVGKIYPEHDKQQLSDLLLNAMGLSACTGKPFSHRNHWSEKDAWVITYGDSIQEEGVHDLKTLSKFLDVYLEPYINGVHILPFYPYSSDDGFSVIEYLSVNDALGDWEDIDSISVKYKLMADLVVNHCSARSHWFENYKSRTDPGKDYFIDVPPEADLSAVVRPRASPLLTPIECIDGKKYVWSTFSHDQVDLDYSNSDVLIEMVKIIRYYLDQGIRILRLDAVAFLWKEIGTTCLHHPKTHEIIRLFRILIEHYVTDAVIITETNVPSHENLSYFGNANEAHGIYNFPLPPLILHALITGTASHLKEWQMGMPPAQTGTFYLNFLASHDGIGLRPVEGLLSEDEINILVQRMETFGGKISWRATQDNKLKPYEINIALFDAFKGNLSELDEWQLERYLCAHAIMLSLEGIPAIYIHSLLGTQNYYEGVERTNQNRRINRYKWDYDQLDEILNDNGSHHSSVYRGMTRLLALRQKQPAFHPNAVQYTLHVCDEIFGFWRQSMERDQSIFCLHNVSNKHVPIPLPSLNLIASESWTDLASGHQYSELDSIIEFAPYQFVWLTNKITD